MNYNTQKMPVLFVGHGNPMNAIEDNSFTQTWHQIGKGIPRPTTILSISAHWETEGTYFTAMQTPRSVHDFGGFPRPLYNVVYPAPGNPELAEQIKSVIKGQVIELDELEWGLDHGTWAVLCRMYPAADIPVVQLSLDHGLPPADHYSLGARLQPLVRELKAERPGQ